MMDEAIIRGVEDLLGRTLNAGQKAQCFLRLAHGGLGLASAAETAAAAYLGSWTLTLRSVRVCLGETSWQRFRTRCPTVADAIGRAETKLRAQSGGTFDAVDWASCLDEPQTGKQGFWTVKKGPSG